MSFQYFIYDRCLNLKNSNLIQTLKIRALHKGVIFQTMAVYLSHYSHNYIMVFNGYFVWYKNLIEKKVQCQQAFKTDYSHGMECTSATTNFTFQSHNKFILNKKCRTTYPCSDGFKTVILPILIFSTRSFKHVW